MHAGRHVITRRVRIPLAAGFAISDAGMLLLSGVSADGSYAADLLPGMLVAGLGLEIILATIAAGAAGPSAVAGLADGIGDAFLAAAVIAAAASAAALVILPSAKTFLPKLALAPRVAVH